MISTASITTARAEATGQSRLLKKLLPQHLADHQGLRAAQHFRDDETPPPPE